jgi:hypothetical protein
MYKIGKGRTTITTRGKTTKVTYVDTVVVKFNDKTIHLNTGGWQTNTTKVRMNQVSNQYGLGYQVYQKKFIWYVDYKGETYTFKNKVLKLNR